MAADFHGSGRPLLCHPDWLAAIRTSPPLRRHLWFRHVGDTATNHTNPLFNSAVHCTPSGEPCDWLFISQRHDHLSDEAKFSLRYIGAGKCDDSHRNSVQCTSCSCYRNERRPVAGRIPRTGAERGREGSISGQITMRLLHTLLWPKSIREHQRTGKLLVSALGHQRMCAAQLVMSAKGQ